MIKNKKKTNISNVITIENNKKQFSECQIKQAGKVQKLLFVLGLPTCKEVKRLSDSNGLRDLPISFSRRCNCRENISKRSINMKRKHN